MEKDNYEVGQNNRAPKVPRHGPGRGLSLIHISEPTRP